MKQQQIKVNSSAGIEAEVAKQFGDLASIVNVEEVTTEGIAGFFAKRHFLVTVNAPEVGDQSVPVLKSNLDREAMANLLGDSEAPLAQPGAGRRVASPMLNTEPLSRGLAGKQKPRAADPTPEPTLPQVMRMVSRDTSNEPLVIFAGLFTDAVDVLGARAYKAGALNETAEPIAGEVAFGLGNGTAVSSWAQKILQLKPDKVIATVDPSRKHEDSALWVAELDAVVKVEAVVAAPFGAKTITPGTLAMLGKPVITR